MSQAPITRAIWPDLPPMPPNHAVAHSERTYSAADFAKISQGFAPEDFPEKLNNPRTIMILEGLALSIYDFRLREEYERQPHFPRRDDITLHDVVCAYVVYFECEHDPEIAGEQDVYHIREVWINADVKWLGEPYYIDSMRRERYLSLIDHHLLKVRHRPFLKKYAPDSPPADERFPLRIRKTYTPAEYFEICQGLPPASMDDKWYAYFEDSWLYIHRSWSRFCLFEVRFEVTHDGFAIAEAWANRAKYYQIWDAAYGAKYCLFAIEMVLYNHGASDAPPEPYPLTEQRAPLPFERTLSAEEYELTRRPYEDRQRHLYIYHYDWLYIQSDWNTPAIFQVRFERAGDGYRAVEAWVSHNPQDHSVTDPARNVRILNEVIDRFLLKKPPRRR